MKFFSNYTWIIIFIIVFYGAIKEIKKRKFINKKVENATKILVFASCLIGILLTCNFIFSLSIIDLLGICIIIWFTGITYIIYQHYLEEKFEIKKNEYKSDFKGFSIITIIISLYVISNLLS